MTDRFNALTVSLEKNIREDDAEKLINAIQQMRGVLTVSGHVSNIDSWNADARARNELAKELWDVLYPNNKV